MAGRSAAINQSKLVGSMGQNQPEGGPWLGSGHLKPEATACRVHSVCDTLNISNSDTFEDQTENLEPRW